MSEELSSDICTHSVDSYVPRDHDDSDGESIPRLQPKRHVILAEDDGPMRAMLLAELEREGFSVIVARDGLELMDAVHRLLERSIQPELIVSDVQMPRCTGLVALATLRRLNLHIPTVLITAFGDEETHAQAVRLGAAILDKPFDLYRFRRLAAGITAR